MISLLGGTVGWLLAAGLFFIGFVLLLLVSNIVVQGHASRRAANDHVEIRITALWGLFRYRVEIPVARMKEKGLSFKTEKSGTPVKDKDEAESSETIDTAAVIRGVERMGDMLRYTYDLTGLIKDSLSRFKLTKWHWSTALGTGDAVWTAMSTGFVWSAKTSMMGVLSRLVRLQTMPRLEVKPLYNQAFFTTEIDWSGRIRCGSAVMAGIRLFNRARKIKGGLKTWRQLLRPKKPESG